MTPKAHSASNEARLAAAEECLGRVEERIKAIDQNRAEWKVEVERRLDEANGHLDRIEADRKELVTEKAYTAGHVALEARVDSSVREMTTTITSISRELAASLLANARDLTLAIKGVNERMDQIFGSHNREDVVYHDKTDKRIATLEEARSEGTGSKEQASRSARNARWIIGLAIGFGFSMLGTFVSYTMLAIVLYKLFSHQP